jgi:hypothetical protein
MSASIKSGRPALFEIVRECQRPMQLLAALRLRSRVSIRQIPARPHSNTERHHGTSEKDDAHFVTTGALGLGGFSVSFPTGLVIFMGRNYITEQGRRTS